MRAVLVDWLVGVHLQFRLLPETVYTTVAILDRWDIVLTRVVDPDPKSVNFVDPDPYWESGSRIRIQRQEI
jgi:hypothetical protein